MILTQTLRRRFHERVKRSRGCWLWTGTRDSKGYGVIHIHEKNQNKNIKAHRLAWRIFKGAIPARDCYHGTMVMHSCDNPGCVNPKHLRLGTALDNNRDRHVKGRSASKLDAKTAREILGLRIDPKSPYGYLKLVSAAYGLTDCSVLAIWRRKYWRHV